MYALAGVSQVKRFNLHDTYFFYHYKISITDVYVFYKSIKKFVAIMEFFFSAINSSSKKFGVEINTYAI